MTKYEMKNITKGAFGTGAKCIKHLDIDGKV